MYLILLLLSIFIIGLNGQIFNNDSIPLTAGAYIPTSETRWTITSLQMKTDKTELVITNSGLKLLHDGQSVWAPFTSDLENPVLYFRPDGNLCIRENPTSEFSLWCTNYYNLGAAYLNILPDGSYGRKWAIVVQDKNGQMLWGRFGPAISNRGLLPLIPGNFIDAKNSSNNKLSNDGRKCINNGKDYFCVNSRSTDIISFYTPLVESNFAAEPLWKISATAPDNPQVIFGTDTNFCATIEDGAPKWCNGLINSKQRYLIIPIASDYENYQKHATWVILDENMQVVNGLVSYLVGSYIDKSLNQATFNGASNDYVSMTFSNGAIDYFNKIEKKNIATFIAPNYLPAQNYGFKFESTNLYFYKRPSFLSLNVCNVRDQECISSIQRFEKLRITGAWSKWDTKKDARWFGISRYLPETVLLDEDGMIIASSKNFDKTHYQYN